MGKVLLFVLIAGHFPYNIVPTEQLDLDRIVLNSAATQAAKAPQCCTRDSQKEVYNVSICKHTHDKKALRHCVEVLRCDACARFRPYCSDCCRYSRR